MSPVPIPRVLIADDDPWTRESLSFLLRDEGYEVLEAANGVEALDILHLSTDPLLVILDLVMPQLTGFEVLRHIATDATLLTRHRYIVFSAQPFRLAIQIGPNFSSLLDRLGVPFIEKPFDIDEVSALVARTHPALAARDAKKSNGESA